MLVNIFKGVSECLWTCSECHDDDLLADYATVTTKHISVLIVVFQMKDTV